MTYVDKYGLWNVKECINGEPSGNDGPILTAYADKLGVPLDNPSLTAYYDALIAVKIASYLSSAYLIIPLHRLLGTLY